MKIGTGLPLGFAVAFAMMIAMAALAVSTMTFQKHQLNDIVTDNMVKVALSHDMKSAVLEVGKTIRNILIIDDAAGMREEEGRLAKQREHYDAAWTALQKLPASNKGEALRTRIHDAVQAARAANNRVVELAVQNKSADALRMLCA